jgi:hypothetical protein
VCEMYAGMCALVRERVCESARVLVCGLTCSSLTDD